MTASTLPAPRLPGAAALAATVWLILAIAAGATGFFLRLPFPGPQLIILGLVGLTLVAGLVASLLRAWIDAVPLRVLVGMNATRFVGIAFLVLAARDQMNQVLADRAGWGDIATATLAIALVVTGAPVTPPRRLLLQAWNALGFLDLVVAVGTATAVTLSGAKIGRASCRERV